jgi:hypothetical protein
LPWTILAFGALLRLFWYFDRGSLWLDEAFSLSTSSTASRRNCSRSSTSTKRRLGASMGGALLLWFAHASMIVLGAGGLVLGAAALVRR